MTFTWKQRKGEEYPALNDLFREYYELFVGGLGTPGPHASVYVHNKASDSDGLLGERWYTNRRHRQIGGRLRNS